MTWRQIALGLLWMTLWMAAMGMRLQEAVNPVSNPYLSSEDFEDLPVLAR